jgi:hypothetical protein
MLTMRIATAALLLAAAPVAAQVTTVDEGSFTISQNGTRIGREDFRIRRTPTGESTVNFVASATVTLGDRQLAPDLRTDTRGGVLAYRVEVRAGRRCRSGCAAPWSAGSSPPCSPPRAARPRASTW